LGARGGLNGRTLLDYAGKTKNAYRTKGNGRSIRAIVPQADYIMDLVAEMRKPWLSVVAPWRDNEDDDFLKKCWQTAETATFLTVRGNLAKCKDFHYEYREKSRLSESEKEAINDIFEDGLNPDSFDRDWFFDICNQAILSGLESINTGWVSEEGLYCPNEIDHIDNRRHKINRETVDTNIIDFRLYLQDPVSMTEIPFYNDNGEPNFPNLIPLRYKNFEFTLGRGLGEGNKFYWDWREIVIDKKIYQIAMEKFTLPFVVVSAPDHPFAQIDADTDGTSRKEMLDSYAEAINESGSASVVVVPFPANIELIDIGKGKIEPMTRRHESITERIGNAILGNAGIVMSEKMSYGASRSVSMVVVKLISQDREFHYRIINKYLKKMFFKKNIRHFQDVKKDIKFRDLPEIKFISDDIDPKNIVEQVKAATAAGYRVKPNFLKENLNVEVEDEPIQPGGQGGFGSPLQNKMDAEGRITPDQKSSDNPLITKSNRKPLYNEEQD